MPLYDEQFNHKDSEGASGHQHPVQRRAVRSCLSAQRREHGSCTTLSVQGLQCHSGFQSGLCHQLYGWPHWWCTANT